MLGMIKSANLALAFLLELAALVAFGYWGFNASDSTVVKLLLGIGVPVLAIVLWGIFAAPRSARRLRGSAYHVFATIFFALAVLALFAAGSATLGIALALIYAINAVLLVVWKQDDTL